MAIQYAISNIALPAFSHRQAFNELREIGYTGIEVAPSRIWHDTWRELKPRDIENYRRTIEAADLSVVGLHSLVFDHPELQLFGDPASVKMTLDFMTHLSSVCRDLGGRTLIWGGGRKRGAVPQETAFLRAVEFMQTLCDSTSGHGTVFCFEPLGPSDSDFINSLFDAIEINYAVNRDNIKIQADAKALVENDEVRRNIFEAIADQIVHFHANEPGLDVIGRSGTVDHGAIGDLLRAIHYNGYVSAEQRMLSNSGYIIDAKESFNKLSEYYHDD